MWSGAKFCHVACLRIRFIRAATDPFLVLFRSYHMKSVIFVGAILVLLIVGPALLHIRIDALADPGRVEVMIATAAKHALVRHWSRKSAPREPGSSPARIEHGDKLFGTECAACHGLDGHSPTDAGRWMYPRAANLTSQDVQHYSDSELFWVVKNGVRLSGMPAFGPVESDENIWNLVHYVRRLRVISDSHKGV